MNKLWLIVQREYLSRVRKRSFIIATLLTPVAIASFIVIPSLVISYESDAARRIAVLDEGNLLNKVMSDENNLHFHFESSSLETLKDNYEAKNYDGILRIPNLRNLSDKDVTVYYYSDQPLGLDMQMTIQNKIGKYIRGYKIDALGLDKQQLETLRTKVTINPEPIDDSKKDDSSLASMIAFFIGMVMGFFMYLTIFIYGMMVMRSVMEEKTNRIVEVMISSVKPFQLMMGKIIGVGAVGLTQVAIWAVLIPLTSFLVQLLFGIDSNTQLEMAGAGSELNEEDMNLLFTQIMTELAAQNWLVIFPLFVCYFLGGYFLYASLFAAIGSVIGDDMGESQSLTIPIFIPIIIALYIMTAAVRAPDSSLAVWASIFPLFSPIVMPARLAFSPPFWQVATSLLLLMGTSIFFVWLTGRIYRMGILMYGKRASFKEIRKWLFYKE
ncbi:MAG: ABC transporter permease [Bacteroidota bacterium]